MSKIKNILKYFLLLAIIPFAYSTFISNGIGINLSSNFRQDTTKSKIIDTLQNAINRYNSIALTVDSIFSKAQQVQNILDGLKKDSIQYIEQNKMLKQELDCEKNDSCKIILNQKFELVKQKNTFVIHSLDSIYKTIANEKKNIASIQKKKENETNKIQEKTTLLIGSHKIKYKGSWYLLFIADTDSCQILMHHKDSLSNSTYRTIDNVYRHLAKNNFFPLMITNAGMYTQRNEPQGLFIENYKEKYSIDTTMPNYNNFYLKPNGVFFIDSNGHPAINTTEDFLKKQNKKAKIKYATQSGPMLLIDGKLHSVFTVNSNNKKIRSGVGVVGKNKLVFAISLDEVNFYDFALLFKDMFNCKNALFLDGAISRMYLSDLAPKEKGGNFGPMISVVKKTK